MLSNFVFLQKEFPLLFNIAQSAESQLYQDAGVCIFKVREFGELLTEILFNEHGLDFPYSNNFHTRLKILEDEKILPSNVADLLFTIKERGNMAVHQYKGDPQEAKNSLFSCFKLAKWFFESYSDGTEDLLHVKFHMPPQVDVQQTLRELEGQYKELEQKFRELLEQRKAVPLTDEKGKAIQQRSKKAARKLDMSEAETRELIDAQLRKAGWEVDSLTLNYEKHKTLPRPGRNMAIAEWPAGSLQADYALFIGLKLYGIVEAKKYAQDISTNLRQSKIYAKQMLVNHGAELLGSWENTHVPFLFSTNGRPYLKQIETKSGIWFLDVRKPKNTSKPLQGWYSPEGLIKLFEKDFDKANEKLKSTIPDFLESKSGLNLRKYQVKAIQAVEDQILQHPEKKRALIAMATGTGKTRTIIGLCYRLIQTNRFRRILFLVDRTLLGTQASNAFKDNKIVDLNTFSAIYDVKELQDIIPDIDTRLHFATVQGMVKRLFFSEEGQPSVDQYDCIIIDEAHRGYILDRELDEEDLAFKDQMDYVSKYRKVLDYFDAYAIGLTATPALHTNEIFGSPIYIYSYKEAVIDGYLIDHDPPYIIKTKLSDEGIVWKEGERPKVYDKESNSIIELEKLEDELSIDVAGFNKLVVTENFNRTVIEQLVKELDPYDQKKTLIFAATDEHADLVVHLLKQEFEKINIEVCDDAIQKITGKSYKPEELVKKFKNEQYPNIAVTVDLLTTGVDVPSICNLVFLRRIKSRILYEQMLGRATRRCDEIGKEIFRIFDAVRIYEALEDYTQMKPVVVNPKTTFNQLVEELPLINKNERARLQLEQIAAKLQRKNRGMSAEQKEQFANYSGAKDPEEIISKLKDGPLEQTLKEVIELSGLWVFLDEMKTGDHLTYLSEHEDYHTGTERGYGKGKKPEDYLQSFSTFVKENMNKISALNIVCTKPKELTRNELRELLLVLDREGYNHRSLNAAWKDIKNEEIAADIISFIRTLAMGNALISHEERIKRAVNKVRSLHSWNAKQRFWIDRFEKQLLHETVLQKEDLNAEPFEGVGGFDHLDRLFDNRLEDVINLINENLYTETA